MKMQRALWAVWLVLSVACGGCVGSGETKADNSPVMQAASSNDLGPPRVLIKRADLSLEADDLRTVAAATEAVVKAHQGFVESSTANQDQYLSMRLRVPVQDLDAVLDELAKQGEVKQRSVSVEDVTAESVDIQARLKNLIEARDRLRSHLQSAGELKDIVAVEAELTRVQSDIDSLEGRLKVLNSQASLSTINFTATRTTVLGPLGYLAHGIWWAVSKLFVIR
jgi:ABC-type phosphate transport system auxiliary subunit